MNSKDKFSELFFKIDNLYRNDIFDGLHSKKQLVVPNKQILDLADKKMQSNTLVENTIQKEKYTFSIRTIARNKLLKIEKPITFDSDMIETVIAIKKENSVITFTFITDEDKSNADANQDRAIEFINSNSVSFILDYVEQIIIECTK